MQTCIVRPPGAKGGFQEALLLRVLIIGMIKLRDSRVLSIGELLGFKYADGRSFYAGSFLSKDYSCRPVINKPPSLIGNIIRILIVRP